MRDMLSEMIDYIDGLNIQYYIDDEQYGIEFNEDDCGILSKTVIYYTSLTNSLYLFYNRLPIMFNTINNDKIDEVKKYIKNKYLSDVKL